MATIQAVVRYNGKVNLRRILELLPHLHDRKCEVETYTKTINSDKMVKLEIYPDKTVISGPAEGVLTVIDMLLRRLGELPVELYLKQS